MDAVARKRKYSKPTVVNRPPKPDVYVRWQNMGPRTLGTVEFDKDHIVVDWIPLRTVSLPERFNDKCEELGQLRRLGQAAS